VAYQQTGLILKDDLDAIGHVHRKILQVVSDIQPERRRSQSEAIHRWKPWEKTTGPKTEEGKKASSQNALKHGMRSAGNREMERLIAQLGRLERETRKEVTTL